MREAGSAAVARSERSWWQVDPAANDQCSEAAAKSAMLGSLLGTGFAAAVAAPKLVIDQLFPEERLYIARAVTKRQAEFGMVRVCARRVLAHLGVPPCPFVPQPDRSPRWPSGIIGSLSHSELWCAAAATAAPDMASFGLDIEEDAPLQCDLEKHVCTATERLWLANQAPASRGWLAKLFFSAKEAFYKCQYGHTKTFLDFLDVELELQLEQKSFAVAAVRRDGTQWERVSRIQGRFLRSHGIIVTVAFLTTDDAPKGDENARG